MWMTRLSSVRKGNCMPWGPKEFKSRHNHKLSGPQSKVAAKVANEVLARTGDEGRAVREANAVGGRAFTKHKGKGGK
jgi:hypothetical protein